MKVVSSVYEMVVVLVSPEVAEMAAKMAGEMDAFVVEVKVAY